MKTNTRWTGSITTVTLVIAAALLFAACGGDASGSAPAFSATVADDGHDGDDHATHDGTATHDADAEDHDADTDADAFAT